jgi:hypothetical protein
LDIFAIAILNRYTTISNNHTDLNYTLAITVVVTIMAMLAVVMDHFVAMWATLQTGP